LRHWADTGETTYTDPATGTTYSTYNGGSCYVFTDEEISYEPVDYGISSIGTITNTSIWVNLDYITSRDYDRTVYFHWYNTNTGTSGSPSKILSAGETSLSREAINLISGTEYRFYITVVNPDGTETYRSSYMYATTLTPYKLTISTSSAYNSVTITAKIDKIWPSDIPVHFFIKEASASTWKQITTKSITAGELTEDCKFSTDIQPATVYYCYVKDPATGAIAPDNADKYTKRRTKNNFAWKDQDNINKGSTFNIIAGSTSDGTWDGSWNDFTSQLAAKASYYGKDYNPETVKKGDALTSEKYNNIAAVVNWLVDNNKGDCKQKLNGVSAGDPVTAAKIKLLATCLNE
jgi:hypothetical protein